MHSFLLALLLACGGPTSDGKEICGDGYDNDGDGMADCYDSDCAGAAFDVDGDGIDDPCPELCDDGLDNDGDDLVDCEDPACDGQGCLENCTDLRDNDKDGKWDCDDSECAAECDLDGDGFLNADYGGDDCDDSEATVYPDAPEICDGLDNDCDGDVDKDDSGLQRDTLTDYFADNDGDGFGYDGDVVSECTQPAGRVVDGGDCNDSDAYVNPAAQEICDGLDNDCDGLFDDDDGTVDMNTATTYWVDADGDGFGTGSSILSCRPLTDHALNGDDCDDADATIGASGMWVYDGDMDGFGAGAPIGPSGCARPQADYVSESLPADCDDADAAVHPGTCDVCGDAVDTDCDGLDCLDRRQGFETGLNWPWTTSGNADWITVGGSVVEGSRMAENGDITHNEVSTMSVTAEFPSCGTVRFWHSGSTEANFDYMIFKIDGSQQLYQSGTWGWTEFTYSVSAGTHTLEWTYDKDGSVDTGYDSVWIDDVRLEGALP